MTNSPHVNHAQDTKHLALRRDIHLDEPMCVFNDADWELMHGKDRLPTGTLICCEPGCRAELVAVQLKNGTRFLRNRPSQNCGHTSVVGCGGGPHTPEHRWIQRRLRNLLSSLNVEVTLEHKYADLWVHTDPPIAVEVQRVPTNIGKRSKSRKKHGASTIWLLTESAVDPKLNRDLFRYPAARIRVIDEDRRTAVKPWSTPESSKRARLKVGATVLRLDENGMAFESEGNYDAKKFFQEVFDGRRRWVGRDCEETNHFSGWVRTQDLNYVRTIGKQSVRQSAKFSGRSRYSRRRLRK